MPVAPRLGHTDGMAVAVLGERIACFPSEADAPFFVRAYAEVPAILDELDDARARLREIDNGLVQRLKSEIDELYEETQRLHAAKEEAEARCARVAAECANYAAQARAGRRAAKQALELGERVARLQALDDGLCEKLEQQVADLKRENEALRSAKAEADALCARLAGDRAAMVGKVRAGVAAARRALDLTQRVSELQRTLDEVRSQ